MIFQLFISYIFLFSVSQCCPIPKSSKHIQLVAKDRSLNRFNKRQLSVSSPTEVLLKANSNEYEYLFDFQLGSNQQRFSGYLDTGSSDFYVFSSENIYCGNNADDIQGTADCEEYGSFSSNESSTFCQGNDILSIRYQDATMAYGVLGSDTLYLDDRQIDNCSFGVASKSNSTAPFLGLGFTSSQDTNYLIPYLLANQGLINSPAYSISLSDQNNTLNPSIVFGAIDKSKYSGILQKSPVPIDPRSGEVSRVAAMLNSVSVNNQTLEGFGDIYSLLDSGTSFSSFPENAYDKIGSNWFKSFDETYHVYYGPCDSLSNVSLNFQFSGVSYPVPLTSFMAPASDYFVDSPVKFKGHCIFQASSSGGSDYVVLGNDFLRNVYLVVDLKSKEIAMASSLNLDTTLRSELIDIVDGIPDA